MTNDSVTGVTTDMKHDFGMAKPSSVRRLIALSSWGSVHAM